LPVAVITVIKILVVNTCNDALLVVDGYKDGSTWESMQDMRGCSEAEERQTVSGFTRSKRDLQRMVHFNKGCPADFHCHLLPEWSWLQTLPVLVSEIQYTQAENLAMFEQLASYIDCINTIKITTEIAISCPIG
jgi:hypothetical protein